MKPADFSNLPRLFTVPETANFLRCSTKHVRKLIAEGILEASIFARGYRISEAALRECLEKRTVNHASHKENIN